jgi:Ca2+-binding RTX toxin-like protein
VNGDGFADLLIGAYLADPNGSDSGASYVIFGADFRNEVDFLGTDGNDALTGTTVDENIVGGLGNDTLNGGAGEDVLTGAAGNDLLNGDAGDDFLRGGTGIDSLDGGAGNDRLEGDEGADTLDGGAGNDVLVGGEGNDNFLFNDTLGTTNVDTLMDFGGAGATVLDVIQLENTGIFSALAATGALSVDNFVSNATGTAMDGDDFIVYNTTTGALFYDADGNGGGAAVQFAVIASDVDGLTAADFVVV